MKDEKFISDLSEEIDLWIKAELIDRDLKELILLRLNEFKKILIAN